MQPSIAIVGAGPAGLTLARLLQHSNIECIVFEGEPDRSSRNQGGSLDLHTDGGQLALSKAGLAEEFKKLSRPDAECKKILDTKGDVLFDENSLGYERPSEYSNRPEVDRTMLRNMLIDSLKPGTIHWNKRVERVELQDVSTTGSATRHTIVFTDGSQLSDVDLVVGADGASSRVRRLVTRHEPYYSGITAIELWKNDVDKSNPWLANMVGRGMLVMFDEGRAVIAQRQHDGSIRTYAGLRIPLDWTEQCGINWNDPPAARKALANNYFGDCGAAIQRLILESDDFMTTRHLRMTEIGHTWEHQLGVTLVGDGFCLMTPFAGVGVNVAMAGALELARALIKRNTRGELGQSHNIATAIAEYEDVMFVRAKKNALRSWQGLLHHFSTNGSQQWASKFKQRLLLIRVKASAVKLWSSLRQPLST